MAKISRSRTISLFSDSLLARDSGALAVLPELVVRVELAAQQLVVYVSLPNIYENFYAVTIKRQFRHTLVNELLSSQLHINAKPTDSQA